MSGGEWLQLDFPVFLSLIRFLRLLFSSQSRHSRSDVRGGGRLRQTLLRQRPVLERGHSGDPERRENAYGVRLPGAFASGATCANGAFHDTTSGVDATLPMFKNCDE